MKCYQCQREIETYLDYPKETESLCDTCREILNFESTYDVISMHIKSAAKTIGREQQKHFEEFVKAILHRRAQSIKEK